MGRRVIDVFLKLDRDGLAEHRKAVFDELMSTGRFFCIRQEEFGAQNNNAMEFCRKAVRRAEYFRWPGRSEARLGARRRQ